MKKLFLIPLLGMLLASCVRDADVNTTPSGPEGEEGKQFLSVSIVSSGSSTRAESTDQKGYKNGTDEENAVKKVRFYFFTLEGEPAPVKYNPSADGEGTYQSYSEWVPPLIPPTESGPNDNIEKVVTADIVINTAKKDKMPRYMVAVLNPTELYAGEDGANLSYEELEAVIKTHNVASFTSAGDDDNGFVMSNSKYIDKEGNEANAVDVTKHIRTSELDAKNNPVILYVERVVARMDLSISQNKIDNLSADGFPVYNTKVVADINGVTDVAADQAIYVKFLGWNVTATTDKSWLVKKVNKSWDIENFFGWTNEPWSEYLRFRSYWAINPDDVKFGYGDFGQALPNDNPDRDRLPYTPSEINLANAHSFKTNEMRDGKWVTYMEENAANPADETGFQEKLDNSKVIIAAQLVGADGKALTLVKWGFNYYTLDGIKAAWAAALKDEVFKRTAVAGGGYKFESIKPEDIRFVTAGSLNKDKYLKTDEFGHAPEAKGRYYSYPQIEKREGEEWTLSNENDAAVSYEAANERVQQMGPAKVWNSGYTYYYFDIAHLGAPEKPGEFGVVRNHIYDADITEIVGLGTPVFDPDEIIYPEKPEEEDSMIAAEINILTWRIVKKSFKLDW